LQKILYLLFIFISFIPSFLSLDNTFIDYYYYRGITPKEINSYLWLVVVSGVIPKLLLLLLWLKLGKEPIKFPLFSCWRYPASPLALSLPTWA